MRYNEETIKSIIKYNKSATEKIEEQKEEIERLNNIINKLEKWLKEEVKTIGKNRRNDYVNGILNGYVNSFRKLQELKGDSSNV